MHQHQFDYDYREFWLRLTWKELIITNHLASTLLFMYCQTGVGLTGPKGSFEVFERRTTGWHKSRCCDLLALTNILFVSKASESNALLTGFDDWYIIHLTDQIVRLLKKKRKRRKYTATCWHGSSRLWWLLVSRMWKVVFLFAVMKLQERKMLSEACARQTQPVISISSLFSQSLLK